MLGWVANTNFRFHLKGQHLKHLSPRQVTSNACAQTDNELTQETYSLNHSFLTPESAHWFDSSLRRWLDAGLDPGRPVATIENKLRPKQSRWPDDSHGTCHVLFIDKVSRAHGDFSRLKDCKRVKRAKKADLQTDVTSVESRINRIAFKPSQQLSAARGLNNWAQTIARKIHQNFEGDVLLNCRE